MRLDLLDDLGSLFSLNVERNLLLPAEAAGVLPLAEAAGVLPLAEAVRGFLFETVKFGIELFGI